MVAYQTAYLKANYPVEYMCALLACFVEKSDKLVTCMDECKRMGIPVLTPDINASSADFTVEAGHLSPVSSSPSAVSVPSPSVPSGVPSASIRFGLAAIKGVGRAAVDVVLRARAAGGPFSSLSDVCNRVMSSEAGGVSRGTIEALIQCGAFASLPGHTNRRALVDILDQCCQQAQRAQKDKKNGQASLADMFGDDDSAGVTVESVPIPNVPDYPSAQLLNFERDLLGLYLSDHPLMAFAARFEKARALRVSDLSEMPDRAEITLGGIITSIKPFTSKKSGDPMAFFTLEDMTGTVSCTMFPAVFAQQGQYLEKDKIVLLKGKANHRERVRDDDEGGNIVEVLADEILQLGGGAAGNQAGPSKIVIRLDPSKRDMMRYVRDTVEQHRGNGSAAPVHLKVAEGGQMHEVRTELLAEFDEGFRQALERILGRQTVWVE